jgi:hypothetical protein
MMISIMVVSFEIWLICKTLEGKSFRVVLETA